MSRYADEMPDDVYFGSDLKKSDLTRLASGYDRIVSLMHGERWWSWKELSEVTGMMDGSISRYYRYAKKRGFIGEKKNFGDGLFKYRLKVQSIYQAK
jgi:hypothetical protein